MTPRRGGASAPAWGGEGKGGRSTFTATYHADVRDDDLRRLMRGAAPAGGLPSSCLGSSWAVPLAFGLRTKFHPCRRAWGVWGVLLRVSWKQRVGRWDRAGSRFSLSGCSRDWGERGNHQRPRGESTKKAVAKKGPVRMQHTQSIHMERLWSHNVRPSWRPARFPRRAQTRTTGLISFFGPRTSLALFPRPPGGARAPPGPGRCAEGTRGSCTGKGCGKRGCNSILEGAGGLRGARGYVCVTLRGCHRSKQCVIQKEMCEEGSVGGFVEGRALCLPHPKSPLA